MCRFKQVIAWAICVTMIAGMVGCKQSSPAKTDVQLPDTFMPSDISISEEDVVYEDNTLYADSQILLTVQTGTTYETVEKLVQKENGEIIGFINFSGDYHIDFPEGKSHEDLNALIQFWSERDFIENVSLNFVHRASTDSIPYENDPWLDTSLDSDKKQDTDWDEANSDGNNWWAEAIRMPTVWEMPVWDSYDFTPVKIGIVDTVFDEFHVDLDNVLLKTWENVDPTNTSLSFSDDDMHGTHVAGIIGAEIGNGKGISGVAACAKPTMYGFAVKGTDSHLYQSLMVYKYAYALMLENGVRVINVSMGDDERLVAAQKADRQGLSNDATIALIRESEEIERFLKKAIDAGYDFLIIKSAGNASDKEWVSCPISAENPYGYRKAKAGEKGERGVWSAEYDIYGRITDPDVKSHIIIVGAARKSNWVDFWSGNGSGTGYLRAEFSNIDCDVYAPGVDILSTVPGDGTDKLQGTSMAAPIVTGIAGLIWSVNPDLSAEQVKKLIILSSAYKALEVDSKTSEDVLIVDAAYAVNMALEWDVAEYQDAERPSCMMGTVYVELTDSAGTSKLYAIRKADIRITSADGQTVTMFSDEDLGTFDVFLPEGEYRISVKAEGFQDYEDTVILREGDVKYLSVKMVPLETELLSSINVYKGNKLSQTYAFQYDEHHRLSSVRFQEYYDYSEYDMDITLTYTYDEAGRLIATDCQNCWLYFGNNFYEYDEQGRLTSHKYYWGSNEIPYAQSDYEYDSQGNVIKETNYIPDYNSNTMMMLDEYAYTYIFNDQGRISEQHKHISWIDDDFDMTTEYGKYPYSKYVEVLIFSYGSDGGVVSVQELMLPDGVYQPEGHSGWAENDGETLKYFDNYPIFEESGYGGVCSRLFINDVMGHEIWGIYIGNAHVSVDDEGRITAAIDNENDCRYEFIYADPNMKNNISAYIPMVEKAISEEMFLPQSKGLLYDMDNDGVQELIMIHEKAEMDGDICIGAYHVCSVFDIENGVLTTKLDEKYLNSMAGAPESYAGIVEYEGSIMFLVHTTNAGDASAGTTSTLYDPLTFRQVLNQKTDKYGSVVDGVRYIDMIDDGYGSMDEYMISGMPLDELLTYLKNN